MRNLKRSCPLEYDIQHLPSRGSRIEYRKDIAERSSKSKSMPMSQTRFSRSGSSFSLECRGIAPQALPQSQANRIKVELRATSRAIYPCPYLGRRNGLVESVVAWYPGAKINDTPKSGVPITTQPRNRLRRTGSPIHLPKKIF